MTSKRQNRSDSRRPTAALPTDYSALLADIKNPGMAGFSPQNIWKMRSFFLAWTAEVRNLSQAVRESRRDKVLSQLVREIDGENLPRVVAEIPYPQ